MPSSTARVASAQAGRYLARLCRHAEAVSRRPEQRLHEHLDPTQAHPRIQRVESSSTHATLHFDRGRCLAAVEPAALTLRVEADDAEILRQIEALIAADIKRFGTHERVSVCWHSDDHDNHDAGSKTRSSPAATREPTRPTPL